MQSKEFFKALSQVERLHEELDDALQKLRHFSKPENAPQSDEGGISTEGGNHGALQGINVDNIYYPEDEASFAVLLVSIWEGSTDSWHGEPHKSAYGLLGFEGGIYKELIRFNGGGANPTQDVQLEFGKLLYNRVIDLSCRPRGITSLLGRAMTFDMAINNGMYHEFFCETDRDIGFTEAKPPNYAGYEKTIIHNDDELVYMFQVAEKRIELRRKIAVKFPGLTTRYEWWRQQAIKGWKQYQMVLVLPKMRGIETVPLKSAKTGRFVSPVDPKCHELMPRGWHDATGYAVPFPRSNSIPRYMWGRFHSGIDFNRSSGQQHTARSPVYAIADGTVEFAGICRGTWGGVITIKHHDEDDISVSRYGHLTDMSVAQGESVKQGQQIGRIGNAGGLVPYHLHFDIGTPESEIATNPAFYSYLDNVHHVFQHYVNPAEVFGS